MTTIGPWTQDPDYDVVTHPGEPTAPINARRVKLLQQNGFFTDVEQMADYEEQLTEWYPVENTTIMTLVETAAGSTDLRRSFDVFGTSQGQVATRITRYHQPGSLGGSDWRTGAFVEMGRRPHLVPPGIASAAAPGWLPFHFAPSWPEGVIDVEFQDDDISTVQSVRLLGSSSMGSANLDATQQDTFEVTSNPTTHILLQSALEFNEPDGPGSSSSATTVTSFSPNTTAGGSWALGADHDLTPYFHGDPIVLSTLTPDFIAPQEVDENYSGLNPSNSWSYGYFFERPDIGWTLRPPVYRFIFSDIAPVTVMTASSGPARTRFT